MIVSGSQYVLEQIFLLITFNALHGPAPCYISDLLVPYAAVFEILGQRPFICSRGPAESQETEDIQGPEALEQTARTDQIS